MPGFNPFRYRFPYTNLNDINLDWIIKQVKQIAAAIQGKQDKPDTTGTAGQVLGLDENLDPVWLDQSGGGGSTTNYNNLTNKPQINGVTLSGNKTASDLGLATPGDIPAVPVRSVNGQTGAVVLDADDVGALPSSTSIPTGSTQLPLMDGEASAGTNLSRFAMEGHRHPTDTSRASAEDVEKILPVITGSTNNSGYVIAVGDYFVANGALYQNKTNAAIPIDGTWSGTAIFGTAVNSLNKLSDPFQIFTADAGADIVVTRSTSYQAGVFIMADLLVTPNATLPGWTLLGHFIKRPVQTMVIPNLYNVGLYVNGQDGSVRTLESWIGGHQQEFSVTFITKDL